MASGAVAGASRTTRMRRSPTAYSISLRPVSSSSAASARMRSPSTARSPGFAITRSPISRLPIGGDEARHRLQRQEIALAAQTADHAGRGEADIGAMAEALAPEDVGDVHLDDRQGGSAQRVENGNGGMCIAAGIDDDTVGRFARLLDPIDELPLVVRLAEVDGEAERGGALEAGFLDIGEGLVAIGLGLPHAEEIEIGPVENEDGGAAHDQAPAALAGDRVIARRTRQEYASLVFALDGGNGADAIFELGDGGIEGDALLLAEGGEQFRLDRERARHDLAVDALAKRREIEDGAAPVGRIGAPCDVAGLEQPADSAADANLVHRSAFDDAVRRHRTEAAEHGHG